MTKVKIEGDNLLDEINGYFGTILVGENPNLKQLTTDLIGKLVAKGIVPNEAVRRAKIIKEDIQEEDLVPVNRIRDLFPRIGLLLRAPDSCT